MTKQGTTARIRPANGKGLWLFVDRPGNLKMHHEDINMFISKRDEDELENVAYAILPDEVEAIRAACEDWLEEERQIEAMLDPDE